LGYGSKSADYVLWRWVRKKIVASRSHRQSSQSHCRRCDVGSWSSERRYVTAVSTPFTRSSSGVSRGGSIRFLFNQQQALPNSQSAHLVSASSKRPSR
jgi:hypothetical protein